MSGWPHLWHIKSGICQRGYSNCAEKKKHYFKCKLNPSDSLNTHFHIPQFMILSHSFGRTVFKRFSLFFFIASQCFSSFRFVAFQAIFLGRIHIIKWFILLDFQISCLWFESFPFCYVRSRRHNQTIRVSNEHTFRIPNDRPMFVVSGYGNCITKQFCLWPIFFISRFFARFFIFYFAHSNR